MSKWKKNLGQNIIAGIYSMAALTYVDWYFYNNISDSLSGMFLCERKKGEHKTKVARTLKDSCVELP